MTDVDSVDFFMDRDVVADPFAYLETLQARCPVVREPHHGVWMVTGWEEASEVAGDADRFSSCISVTGPFPGFPVPVEGRDDVAGTHCGSIATSCRSTTSCRRWTRRCTPTTAPC